MTTRPTTPKPAVYQPAPAAGKPEWPVYEPPARWYIRPMESAE